MDIDRHADVVVEAHRELDVSPFTAWKVLADIEAWPSWVPSMRRAVLDGAVLHGGGFNCDDGSPARCVLYDVERPRRLSWTADSLLTHHAVVWEIQATGPTSSRVVCRQSSRGLGPRAARWLGRRPEESTHQKVDAWVDALRRRVRSEVPCD